VYSIGGKLLTNADNTIVHHMTAESVGKCLIVDALST
jgi:hypothetical protein